MKTKIENYLGQSGFQKLGAEIPGMSVYFTIEKSYINALVFVEADGNPEITAEDLDGFLDKSDWKASNGEVIDVHALTLLFSSDVEKARQIGRNQVFCWYIDSLNEKLVIDADKCEDFYGMKGILKKAMTDSEPPEGLTEVVAEAEDSGKRSICYINFALLIANIVLFLCCLFFGDFIYEAGIFDLGYIFGQQQWYRFLTSIFLHGDVYHLSGNMLYLYTLGELAERELGRIKYVLLYLLSGLAGNVFSMVFSLLTKDVTPSLGASGAIFGITGALLWIIIRNKGKYAGITVPKIIFLIAYSLYNGFISTNVDNAAHLGGLLGGFVLAVLLYRKKGKAKERGTKE